MVCATCVAGGKWTEECVNALVGRNIIVLQDNDTAGREKARGAARALYAVAKTVRVVLLPGLPDKGDVSDWLDADPRRGRDELAEVCMAAPLWEADTEAAATDNASDAQAPQPRPSLNEWDAGDDDAPIPPREWLLGNVFCRGFVSSLVAAGGVGKTSLRIAQLLSLACGRPLTGEHVFQRCRVLLISMEDNVDELRRRVRAAMMHHSIKPSDVKGWLFLSAPRAELGKLMTTDAKGRTTRGALADVLAATIIERKIDIVCLDPFVKTHSVEENDNSAIDDVITLLADMCAVHNVSIDVPHHLSKGTADPGNADRSRGASAMKDGARLVYTVAPMNEDEGKAFDIPESERREYLRVDSAKVNIAPHMAKADWFRLVGVHLGNASETYPNGDTVQTVIPWMPPDPWDGLNNDVLNRILSDIDAGLPEGQRYTDAPKVEARAAWRVVQKHVPEKNEAQCRTVIRTWVKSGVLIKDTYANPETRKEVTGLRLDATKRPGTVL